MRPSRSCRRAVFALALWGCGGAAATVPSTSTGAPPPPPNGVGVSVEKVLVPREQPPASGDARDIHFPAIERGTTPAGLEVNTITLSGLPVLQVRLVVKSGSATDPAELPGTAQLVAQMLKEGTARRTSAKIAEAVDFLGAKLRIHSDQEHLVIGVKATSDQLKDVLELVAELATQPVFDEDELKKLKKRELDRLSLMSQSPSYLARREFWKALYGPHPYARVDTTKDAVKRLKRSDLLKWHRRYMAPNNAYLLVVGDVGADQVLATATRAFKDWQDHKVATAQYPEAPARSAREIVLVDRPESVQSVIYVGNLALPRTHPDFVPLLVANQVLGGSAASRMFMDLREKQSLTYGAYSDVDEGLQTMPFRAFAAVRNEVTAQAMKAFMEHLQRIVSEPVPDGELADAKRYLTDSFPLRIETSGEIAGLATDLRTYGFPDDYWDGFRAQIQAVTSEHALAAAKQYITPDRALIVVVGKAAAIKDALAEHGPVRVIDVDGNVLVDAAAAPTKEH